jgi:cholinesterase
MKLSLVLATACAAAVVAELQDLQSAKSNWTVGQTVRTSSGPVSGHPASNQSQVSEYLGIPFGQPPVGNLRFAAPVRFNGTAHLNGSDFVRPPSHPDHVLR